MQRKIIFHSYSAKDTKKLGNQFAEKIIKTNIKNNKPQIILLFGDLGSGKTSFSKGFADYFSIKRMLSPTFNIIKYYNLRQNVNNENYIQLIHADLYRIKYIEELKNIDFFNILTKKGIISLIEWPDILEQFLVKNFNKKIKIIKINFNYGDRANQRIISYNEFVI